MVIAVTKYPSFANRTLLRQWSGEQYRLNAGHPKVDTDRWVQIEVDREVFDSSQIPKKG